MFKFLIFEPEHVTGTCILGQNTGLVIQYTSTSTECLTTLVPFTDQSVREFAHSSLQ